MSVIINDFEIITDASGDEGDDEAEETGSSSQPQPASIRPTDVVEVTRREHRRRRRLRAH
jgi:hypothetical protein